jgi:hypothetical protein
MRKLILIILVLLITISSFAISFKILSSKKPNSNTNNKTENPGLVTNDRKYDLGTVPQANGTTLSVGQIFDLNLPDNTINRSENKTVPHINYSYQTDLWDENYYSPDIQAIAQQCNTTEKKSMDLANQCEDIYFKYNFLRIETAAQASIETREQAVPEYSLGVYTDSQDRTWTIYKMPVGPEVVRSYLIVLGDYGELKSTDKFMYFTFNTASDKYKELLKGDEQNVVDFIKSVLSSASFSE